MVCHVVPSHATRDVGRCGDCGTLRAELSPPTKCPYKVPSRVARPRTTGQSRLESMPQSGGNCAPGETRGADAQAPRPGSRLCRHESGADESASGSFSSHSWSTGQRDDGCATPARVALRPTRVGIVGKMHRHGRTMQVDSLLDSWRYAVCLATNSIPQASCISRTDVIIAAGGTLMSPLRTEDYLVFEGPDAIRLQGHRFIFSTSLSCTAKDIALSRSR